MARLEYRMRQPVANERGFTLVEMMVAIAIGLFLVGGLTTLLVSTSVARTELDKSSRQIENGRYALQLLSDDIRHAGFFGTYFPPKDTVATAPDPCATAVASLGFATPAAPAPVQMPVAVYGYDGGAADPSCVPNRLAGTDILVIRRVSTTSVAAAAAVANEVYFQSSACADIIPPPAPFVLANSGFTLQTKTCGAALAPLNKYMVRIYYVSSCNVCAGPNADTLPTLKVVEYVLGAMTVTPLVEGIQTMQLDYGIDMDGDGGPDCYISNPESPAGGEIAGCTSPAGYWATATALQNWSNVVTVRAHILARNLEPSGGWKDTRTYSLGLAGTTTSFNDSYKRHVYSNVVRVVNAAGRRETP